MAAGASCSVLSSVMRPQGVWSGWRCPAYRRMLRRAMLGERHAAGRMLVTVLR